MRLSSIKTLNSVVTVLSIAYISSAIFGTFGVIEWIFGLPGEMAALFLICPILTLPLLPFCLIASIINSLQIRRYPNPPPDLFKSVKTAQILVISSFASLALIILLVVIHDYLF